MLREFQLKSSSFYQIFSKSLLYKKFSTKKNDEFYLHIILNLKKIKVFLIKIKLHIA